MKWTRRYGEIFGRMVMPKAAVGRRRFVAAAGAAALGFGSDVYAAEKQEKEEEVAPGEDLMREHGVLRRVIQDYHEKLEEDFLFPRFEKARKLTELVSVLRRQHEAGRRVTADVVKLAKAPIRTDSGREQLANRLRAFTRMYRPHAVREDTVLFPAFHDLVGREAP
jgi:hemerythrin-like domain-containing protein